MRTSLLALTIAWLPTVRAQEVADRPVRVSVAHAFDPLEVGAAPRLLPAEDAPSLLALGPSSLRRLDDRVLDLVSYQAKLRFGLERGASVRLVDTDLVVDAPGVDREKLRDLVLEEIDVIAPAVTLDVAVYRAGPAPTRIVIPAGELDREVAGPPLGSARAERASGQRANVAMDGPDTGKVRLRVEPHLLVGSRSIALLCEFALDHRARDGARRWTAGTASGVVPVDGALALTLPDRVLVIRASHTGRPQSTCAGVPWSLLTTTALRREPELGEGKEPLALSPVRAGALRSGDALIQELQRSVRPAWWHSRIVGDQSPGCLLLSSQSGDLEKALPDVRAAIAELERPLVETAQLDGRISVEAKPAVPGLVRLPVMPGRVACVLHGAWSADGAAPRGVLVALTWDAEPDGEHAEVSGFAIRLRGEDLTERVGDPLRFRGFELGRDGRAGSLEAGDLSFELHRPH